MSITFREYMNRTGETAVYPRRLYKEGLMYAALGLVSEVKEFEETADDLVGEAGDVVWFAAEIFNHLGSDMDPYAMTALANLGEGIDEDASFLAAEVAGHVSKVWREGILDERKEEAIIRCTAGIVANVMDAAELHGYSFVDVLEHNLNKLASRKERGVLHGDGGSR